MIILGIEIKGEYSNKILGCIRKWNTIFLSNGVPSIITAYLIFVKIFIQKV